MPSASRLELEKLCSDHYHDLTAQMVLPGELLSARAIVAKKVVKAILSKGQKNNETDNQEHLDGRTE